MLCNLPHELQFKKMSVLHEAIEKNFGIKSKSFRAGRWGYDGTVATGIRDLGYAVDTSITPFMDWSEYHGRDFTKMTPEPYRFNAPEIFKSIQQEGGMTEIPATIGYLQDNYEFCNAIDRLLTSRMSRIFRLKGLLNRMKLINKVLLSPEGSDCGHMIELTKVLMRKKYEIVNMFFHSTSLQAGLSFIVKTREDEIRFSNRLKEYFTFTSKAGIKPITLSEAGDIMQGAGSL
jgi:hypothetical protein